MLRFACLLMFLASTAAHAACIGTDLRSTLTPDQSAEVARQSAARINGEGLLWRATRGSDTAYVLGTMHIHDPAITDIFDRIEPLALSADLILTETTLDQESELQRLVATDPSLFFITEGPTLIDLMPEEDWQALSRQIAARGMPPFMAAKMRPWFLALSLAFPPCMAQDMNAGKRGLDHLLMTAARDHAIPNRALEPIDTIFTLFAQEPMEEQIKGLKLSILPNEIATDILTTMVATYVEGKHAQTSLLGNLLTQWSIDMPIEESTDAFAEIEKLMLDQRNHNWMPVIEAAQPEGTLFIAVGAAHLSGEAGVLNLLAQAGYTVTPEPF